MENKEYKVLQFKKGDFQDPHGNFWCDMALEGEGEPVRIVVKDPMQYSDGMTLYGHITDETSKANKPYKRFRRESKPDVTYTKQGSQEKPTDEYWADKQAQIRAQWAIGQAVRYVGIVEEDEMLDKIEQTAKELYAMVDRVKDSNSDKEAQEELGLEVADKVDNDKDQVHEDVDEDKPIDLSEIPF